MVAFVLLGGVPLGAYAQVFLDQTTDPALRLGRIGHDFANQGQCFPADAMFQVAFNESGNVHYLIARADCYAAFGHTDFALAGFEWARDSGADADAGERHYIDRLIARLSSPSPEPANVAAPVSGTAERERREPNGYLRASAAYRMNDTIAPPVPQADLSQPHMGAEWGWFPLRGRLDAGHDLGLFVRAFGAVDTDSVQLRDDTLQAGVGLRLKPLPFTNLVLRGEWLVPIGENAREGWLLSASHEWGVGGAWRSTNAPWIVANTQLDASWLPEDPEFVSAGGETLLGAALPLANRLALIPHGVASLRYSEDQTAHNALGEAGLGLGLRYWVDDGRVPGALDLLVQYRWFVFDDTALPLNEDGTWVGRIIIRR